MTDQLVEFVRTFGRMEFALKRAGFYTLFMDRSKQCRSILSIHETDWPGFATSIGGAFAAIHDPEFVSACQYITAAPPKRQRVRMAECIWNATPRVAGESDERYILRLVNHVRRNLFHDGPDESRQDALMNAATIILRRVATINPVVESWFTKGECAM